jgi:hypothetical protein
MPFRCTSSDKFNIYVTVWVSFAPTQRRYDEVPVNVWPADGVLQRPSYNVFVLESRAAGRRWTIDLDAGHITTGVKGNHVLSGGRQFTCEALDAERHNLVKLQPASSHPTDQSFRQVQRTATEFI